MELWEEPLHFLRDLSLRIGRTLERLVRELKTSEELKFVTISFLMSWIFAIVAKTRRVLISLRDLNLLKLKIKVFGGLLLTWLI